MKKRRSYLVATTYFPAFLQRVGMVLVAMVLVSCNPDGARLDQARKLGEKLATKGRDDVSPCIYCHGKKGEGTEEFPRLAGLDPRYIHRQLQDFARDPTPAGAHIEPIARDYSETPRIYSDLTVFTPAIRQDPIMGPIAKALTVQDSRNLAIYYARKKFTATPVPAEFQTLERGEDLALRGKPEYGMPACVTCHAPDGQGFGEHFPPLAGQPVPYLVTQIDRWQLGQRDNDNLGLMRSVANQMTDGDKRNAAVWSANRSFEWNAYDGAWPWED